MISWTVPNIANFLGFSCSVTTPKPEPTRKLEHQPERGRSQAEVSIETPAGEMKAEFTLTALSSTCPKLTSRFRACAVVPLGAFGETLRVANISPRVRIL